MTDNNPKFFAKDQEEIEEAHFGGDIYKYAYKLPDIIITGENIETFKNYTKLVKDISETCGREITLLFAHLYKIYNMEDHQNNPTNKKIIDFCTQAIGQLSLSLKQSEKLLLSINYYENKKDNLEINGKEYCFIVLMTNKLFFTYSHIYNFILRYGYFDKESLETILQRLSFILSEEFDSIRRLFKVVECYKEIETSPTFH
jgi:hypothetical protein